MEPSFVLPALPGFYRVFAGPTIEPMVIRPKSFVTAGALGRHLRLQNMQALGQARVAVGDAHQCLGGEGGDALLVEVGADLGLAGGVVAGCALCR